MKPYPVLFRIVFCLTRFTLYLAIIWRGPAYSGRTGSTPGFATGPATTRQMSRARAYVANMLWQHVFNGSENK